MNKIPGYNKCPLCGAWEYELVGAWHTCKPLWLALVLPADASERDILIAITEADNTDSWDKVRGRSADFVAEDAALRACDNTESPANSLVILREAAKPDVTLLFDVEACIRPEFSATERKRKVTP